MPVMSNTIISSNLIATLIITRKFPQLFFATAAVCDKIFKSHRLSELLAFCIHLGEKSETDWINWMNDALSPLSLLLVFSFINEWERKSTARRAWAEIVMRMRRRAFFCGITDCCGSLSRKYVSIFFCVKKINKR